MSEVIVNLFERASREKTRFPYKGYLSVEDLWDLSVTELDSIFKLLNAKLRIAAEESLLGAKAKVNTDLELQTAIIRHVVTIKLAEMETAKLARERREKKQRILGILAEKQYTDLAGKSVEDLTKMLEEL